jgi:1,6-anhydro-N-acetylmuramate kinase
VYDLRAADLAAGGEGAPITPIADLVLFGDEHEVRAVVNLGGFCNYTLLPAMDRDERARGVGQIRASDVCACNQLLDTAARSLLGVAMDLDGAAGAGGSARRDVVDAFCSRLARQSARRRSLGSDDEPTDWLDALKGDYSAPDVLRSACEAIAATIVRAISDPGMPQRVLLAGGGTRNQTLLNAIKGRGVAPVTLTDELGVPAEFREAAAMAVLGALCQDGVPVTLSQITHSQGVTVSGTWA